MVRLTLAALVLILGCAGLPALDEAPGPAADKTAKAAKAARAQRLREVLLDHFILGVEAPRAWHEEVRKQNGARFDFCNHYLSGGVGKGEPWFFKYKNVESFIEDGKALGMGVWFTWFMLEESKPCEYLPNPQVAAVTNAKNVGTMHDYFDWYKKTMIECGKHPEVPIVMQIECDAWSHLLLGNPEHDPAKVEIKVGSCGVEELAGLPDNQLGWAAACVRLRDRYAPMVLLSCNPSGWDYKGWQSGTNLGKIFKTMCDGYDLADFETSDQDLGFDKQPPYGDQVPICKTFPQHIQWIRDFHEVTGLWVMVWGVPIGNTWFATCDNSPGHCTDNTAQYLLEEYPKNDAIARYAAAGCCGFLFNGGKPNSTRVNDNRGDGITNPKPIPGNEGHQSQYADDDGGYLRLRAAQYYKRPYTLLGKKKPDDKKPEDAATAAPPKPQMRVQVADQEAQTRYLDRLRVRLREEIGAGRHPRFDSKRQGGKASIEGASDRVVTIAVDGSRLDLPWQGLDHSDLAQLALAQARATVPADHAIAAFFLMLSGERAAAEEQLAQAADGAEDVRNSFHER